MRESVKLKESEVGIQGKTFEYEIQYLVSVSRMRLKFLNRKDILLNAASYVFYIQYI